MHVTSGKMKKYLADNLKTHQPFEEFLLFLNKNRAEQDCGISWFQFIFKKSINFILRILLMRGYGVPSIIFDSSITYNEFGTT